MPRLVGHEPKQIFSMRLHADLLEAVREAARDSADTVSGFIEQVLRDRLRRKGYLPRRGGG